MLYFYNREEESMFSEKLILSFCCFYFGVRAVCAQPAVEWQHIGLAGYGVQCILTDSTLSEIIAGTGDGLFIRRDTAWHPISTGGDIRSIIRVDSGNIVIALGDSGTYDGIYIGRDVFDGPPYYELKLITALTNPHAIASYNNGEVLYVSSGNTILWSKRKSSGIYDTFNTINTPEFCFGTLEPVCADLKVRDNENELYACGYDRQLDIKQTQLLKIVNDSIQSLIAPPLSAMEFVFGSFLYAGTRNTSVVTINFHSFDKCSLSASPNNELVNDVYAIYGSGIPYYLIAAVKSGIYSTRDAKTWQELGDIQSVPLCITANTQYIFEGIKEIVGTESGVYISDLSTGIEENDQLYHSIPKPKVSVNHTANRKIAITYSSHSNKNVLLSVVDLQGKTVLPAMLGIAYKNSHRFIIDKSVLSKGTYLLHFTSDGFQSIEKLLYCQ